MEDAFVAWFRSTAPYIHAHRGATFVVVFGGELMTRQALKPFVHDVALLRSLGVRLVLVAGARPQIDARMQERGLVPQFHHGLRVTDDAALLCVKESVGAARVELEALLSTGVPGSPMAGARVEVVTGNVVMARPVGVIDGVDYQHTGAVRRIDAKPMQRALDAGAVVLLSPIGYSMTGEAFNVSTHDVGASAAVALGADKWIGLTEGKGLSATELTPEDAELLVASKRRLARDVRFHLASAARVCREGVRRAHLVPRSVDGGLLKELFTREGVGTLVTAEAFEGMRAATRKDVAGLIALLEPLEEAGVLVRRSRQVLETDVGHFVVIERDGMVVGCAALYTYAEEADKSGEADEKMAELACVAVHPRYQTAGRGDQLLGYVERQARMLGVTRLVVLTTQTAHWFLERGFVHGTARDLPKGRRARYDARRRSKVLVKKL